MLQCTLDESTHAHVHTRTQSFIGVKTDARFHSGFCVVRRWSDGKHTMATSGHFMKSYEKDLKKKGPKLIA